jgi:DNA-binding NarL/FixJ family response regulator
MGDPPISVLSVEDNLLVSDALERKLAGDARFVFLGAVSTLADLRAKSLGHPPMVVCMDYHIPGQDAVAMIRMLRDEAPQARVLVLSGGLGHDTIKAVVDAGAWGYITKADESREIVDALFQVAQGKFVLGSNVRHLYPDVGELRAAANQSDQAVPTVRKGLWTRLLGGQRDPGRAQ